MSSRQPHEILTVICCVAALVLGACASSSGSGSGKRTIILQESPPGESADEQPARRKQPVLVSKAEDARVGREATRQVEAEIGILDDDELNAYVNRIGQRLLKGLPHRSFKYEFHVVDQVEPNAFALPGGYIFISRGLLALANNEDELANVIGHEITHAAQRHAAARQALIKQKGMLLILPTQAADVAAYGRDMERSADKGGQILAAAAGYDPQGMSTFMGSLRDRERLLYGASRRARFFDTHPTSTERASVNAIRASEIRWVRNPALGDTVASHLREIDGIDIGPRPEEGVFVDERFLHPDLDFQVRFPNGWRTMNSRRAVGAQAPRGEAVVFLNAESKDLDPKAAAEAFIAETKKQVSVSVTESKPVKVLGGDGWRLQVEAAQRGATVTALVTFLPHGDALWRFTGASLAFDSQKYQGRMLSTFRSFRPLTPEQRASIRGTRLSLVEARDGETIAQLCARTDNVWSVPETSLSNGVLGQRALEGGKLVKIALSYPYEPPRP
jgi:predicted Zn-dependent protease